MSEERGTEREFRIRVKKRQQQPLQPELALRLVFAREHQAATRRAQSSARAGVSVSSINRTRAVGDASFPPLPLLTQGVEATREEASRSAQRWHW